MRVCVCVCVCDRSQCMTGDLLASCASVYLRLSFLHPPPPLFSIHTHTNTLFLLCCNTCVYITVPGLTILVKLEKKKKNRKKKKKAKAWKRLGHLDIATVGAYLSLSFKYMLSLYLC